MRVGEIILPFCGVGLYSWYLLHAVLPCWFWLLGGVDVALPSERARRDRVSRDTLPP